ncbi:protein of unknown function DUF1570 [Pirellula staleyi DSM 6068]|uniref:DUF1570 domain-containing protein n=1 Tax=Pirellula staleyi (strain ATCC 27377 / DSM 6068 / ICPB 4128) TaxID=530564 RepID=D2R209_PIRSD|nr:protein of unknown function DUF1570 [Pirellula staleyi DSM 6068]
MLHPRRASPVLAAMLIACFVLVSGQAALAIEHVTMKRDGRERLLVGKVEVEAADGGILLLGVDGQLWPIPKEELVSRKSDDTPFAPLAAADLAAATLKDLPDGFRVHSTKHYLIIYNTSNVYAEWVGALYERLYSAFYTFWTHRGIELKDPEFPLVAVVFDSQSSYAAFSRHELGEGSLSIIGYYSLQTNRVVMYDLTGSQNDSVTGGKQAAAKINQILSRPEAERNVATIVHEATHQLVHNSGFQQRFADIPFWVSEGLAIYFETPDLASAKGWRNIGGVNRVNLLNFRQSLNEIPAGKLMESMLDDSRFRDPKQASAAYGQSWALVYFLMKTRGDKFAVYLKELSQLTPLVAEGNEERLKLFTKHLGDDTSKLEADFMRYMRTVR